MMGQFCPAMTKVAKAGSLTDFSSCLKLPHHPPSPPSFFGLSYPCARPRSLLGKHSMVTYVWLGSFLGGGARVLERAPA
jgi:hypothetical protein